MKNMNYKYLENIKPSQTKQYGNKAVNLGILMRSGLNVPQGIAFPVDFSMKLFSFSEVQFDTNTILATNNVCRDAVLNINFSRTDTAALREVYDRLNENSELAVRSSSAEEDGSEYSMAGLYESVTGIKTFDELIHAVKTCIASLYSDKAVAHYLEKQLPPGSLAMPFIIQEFKHGTPSGVLFTADPVKNSKDTIIISGAAGSCGQFVQGTDNTFRIKLPKNGKISIPESSCSHLSENQLNQLFMNSLKAEQIFGCPQDIEWTFQNESLWLLQSRPVTGLKTEQLPVHFPSKTDKQYCWRLEQKSVKPLHAEVMKLVNEAMNRGCEISGLAFFYSAGIFTGNAFYARGRELPGADKIAEEYSVRLNKLKENGQNIFSDVFLPEIRKKAASLKRFAAADISNSRITEYLDEALSFYIFSMGCHWQIVHGCLYEDSLEYLKNKYNLTTWETIDLIHSETRYGAMRKAIMEMAITVQESAELTAHFNSCRYDIVLLERLKHTPAAGSFMKKLAAYLESHGLQTIAWDSIEILEEHPEKIIGAVRTYLGENLKKLFTGEEASRQRKIKLADALNNRLSPGKAKQLAEDLSWYRKSYLVRDDHSYYIDSGSAGHFRKALIMAGNALAFEGVLDNYNEVMFFHLEELKSILLGRHKNPRRMLIKRKQQWQRNEQYIVPAFIGTCEKEIHNEIPEAAARNDSEILNGYSAFGGKVSGKVVRPADLARPFDKKYILLLGDIREMDPTPFLSKIAGIVCENGSPFEHIGIWAREHNLPAIFNVQGAGRVFKSGDSICIDGSREICYLEN